MSQRLSALELHRVFLLRRLREEERRREERKMIQESEDAMMRSPDAEGSPT